MKRSYCLKSNLKIVPQNASISPWELSQENDELSPLLKYQKQNHHSQYSKIDLTNQITEPSLSGKRKTSQVQSRQRTDQKSRDFKRKFVRNIQSRNTMINTSNQSFKKHKVDTDNFDRNRQKCKISSGEKLKVLTKIKTLSKIEGVSILQNYLTINAKTHLKEDAPAVPTILTSKNSPEKETLNSWNNKKYILNPETIKQFINLEQIIKKKLTELDPKLKRSVFYTPKNFTKRSFISRTLSPSPIKSPLTLI